MFTGILEGLATALATSMPKYFGVKPPEPFTDRPAHKGHSGTVWHSMVSAPRDGSTIVGLYEDGECNAYWSDRPVCMLGSRCGGFPPGWAVPHGEDADFNLPLDPPLAWRPLE